jgi:DNA-binding NtrC family response regulator
MPTVLIVEDEIQVLIMAESVLQRVGYKTLTVAEAQAIINSGQEIDLIFTEVAIANHPDGGITIGKVVEQSRDGVPVLYTSGRELTDGMQALFASKSKFLPKPYTEQQLTETVASLLVKKD